MNDMSSGIDTCGNGSVLVCISKSPKEKKGGKKIIDKGTPTWMRRLVKGMI